MALAISLQVRRQITSNGFQNYAPTNKVISLSTNQPLRVIPFADTTDTSIYSVVISRPQINIVEEYYCAQTVAAIQALIVA